MIDFKKAFDLVGHDILLKKLKLLNCLIKLCLGFPHICLIANKE